MFRNRKRWLMKSAALLAFCLIAATADAQQKTPTKKPVATPTTARRGFEVGLPTIEAPLSSTAKALHNYSGDPIEIVVLSFKPQSKGEFETTAEYTGRVAALRPARTYSFWLDNSTLVRRFDADREVVILQIPVNPCSLIGSAANCGVSSILVKTIDQGSHEYAGTNAFGAIRQVTRLSRHRYSVIVNSQTGYTLDFEVPMTREKARTDKDLIEVLITVGPNPAPNAPATFNGTSSSPATFSTPLEVDDEYSYLNMPVTAIWLVDYSTGVVLQKLIAAPR
jgi:hypothetical protein